MRILLLLLAAASFAADYKPPAGARPAARRPGIDSVLPGGRILTPLGRQFPTGPGTFGIAVSADGRLVATADGGPNKFTVTLVDKRQSTWQVRQLTTTPRRRNEKGEDAGDADDWHSVFLGVAFDKGGRLFVSEGNSGKVRVLEPATGRVRQVYRLDQGQWRDSYSGDLALDERRNLLYVLDQAHFRLATFDLKSGKLIGSLRVGRLPYKLALAPDGVRAYVTNVGMFEYKPVPGADAKRARETGLAFPAFGFPSAEAQYGARRQTAEGEVDVPGLGEPNHPESNSLAVVDLSSPSAPRLITQIPTGVPFGPSSLGGSSPSGLAVTADAIFVSNANQDSLTVIDPATLKVRAPLALRIPGLTEYRGILPLGMAVDEHGRRLFVAEAGINAVAVYDLRSLELQGRIPAGWFPTAVAVAAGQVHVANARGAGTGPSATKSAPLPRGSHAELRNGMLSVYWMADIEDLAPLSAAVNANNGFKPAREPRLPVPPAIHHVVIIVKENRTYDEVFGDMEAAANGPLRGAPELARLGEHGRVTIDRESLQVRFENRPFNVTPNHHALARRFAFSDNFYADSEVSVDGHHWIVGSYPNAWTETSLMASYGGEKDFRLNPDAPGRLAFAQSNSSVHPEDQLEAGALWHHLERNGIPFRNFGEGFELAGVDEGAGLKPTGARFVTNVPMPEPLWRNTSRDYAQYNMNVPDQFRADAFIAEIDKLYVKTGGDLPRLLFIHLPNDHMAKPRPVDGYPFRESFVADNDYALGRIVEYLTHSKWWPTMAILVTEDDAQGGVDHVDSHRTVLLAVSPYAKRGYASHENTSFPGLLKTAFRLLGVPPLNLYDATAADLADCFTDTPDFTPYKAMATDPVLFDPAKAKDPLDPEPSPRMDDPAFLREQRRQK